MENAKTTSDRSMTNGYAEENRSNELVELLQIFLRRWKLFMVLAVPVFVGISLSWAFKPYSPNYRAAFDLGVADVRGVDDMFSQLKETPTSQIGSVTQQVISNFLSVNIARAVVDELSLFVSDRTQNPAVAVKARAKSDFDEPLGPYRVSTSGGKLALLDQNGNRIAQAGSGEPIDLGPVEVTLTLLPGLADDGSHVLTFYSPARTALALRNSLSIKVLNADKIDKETGETGIPFSGEGSAKSLVDAKSIFPGMNQLGILRISVYWGTPSDALDIAQCLSRQIIRENLNDKSVQFIQSRRFIESQLTLYLDKLNLLEDRIREFKETKKITNLNASTQAKISQISGIETRKSQLEIEEAILKNLSRYLVNSPRAIAGGADTSFHFAPALLSSPVLQGLYSTMLQSEAELRGRLKSYSPGHPKILEIQSTLTGLKDQLREEAAKRLITIRSEIGSVGSEITSLQGKLESVPADEIQLARLERDRETAEKLYTFFSEKLEETRVQEAGITSDLKLINPPAVSNTPVNPRGRMTSLILSLIFSILISIGAIFGVEYFDNTVKHLDLLKRKIDLPIFATIPEFNQQKHDKGKRSISWARKKRPAPVDKKSIIDDLSSPEFEAFRKLAINLTFAHPEKKYRVLYITSPGPEDGKTFLTLNLGTVLSVTGKKVLVIDTDFRKRKGHLSDVTEHKKEIGIFEVLEGKNRLKDVIVNIPERKLDLIPIGSVPPNPFIFLESERMKLILDTLKADYDHILIDGLPVLLFADATYLAAAADGALLSCRYGKTNLRALEESHEILKTSKTDVVGLILNYVPISRGSYYYSYYYKHYNKYYKKA